MAWLAALAWGHVEDNGLRAYLHAITETFEKNASLSSKLVSDHFDRMFCDWEDSQCRAKVRGRTLVDAVLRTSEDVANAAVKATVPSFWIPMTEDAALTLLCDFFGHVVPKLEASDKIEGYVLLTLPFRVGEHGSPWEHHQLDRIGESYTCRQMMRKSGLGPEELLASFLMSSKLRAWFVADHGPLLRLKSRELEAAWLWVSHRKLRHVPLGVGRNQVSGSAFVAALRAPQGVRDILLYINFRRHAHREYAEDVVVANFAGALRNEFSDEHDTRSDVAFNCTALGVAPVTCDAQAHFYASVLRSRFVLSPFGSKADCHRHWEIILLGAVPVMLRSPPLLELFDGLPAVFVSDWADVTPTRLAHEAAYYDASRLSNFDWRKLTGAYWRHQIYIAKEPRRLSLPS